MAGDSTVREEEAVPGRGESDAVSTAFPIDDDDPEGDGLDWSIGGAGSDPVDPAAGTDGTPRKVELENSFFRCFEEPYFRLSDPRGGQPVFVCKLGNDEMVLPFKGIMQECDIAEESPDGRMLTTIGQALRYVKVIRPGDRLPPELFSDGVSWQVEKSHTELAHKKLSGLLLAWIFEGDTEVSTAEMLERMSTDATAKAKLNEAFSETARQLGLGEGGREKVAEMIEELAVDLAYIEALRARYMALERIQTNLLAIQKLHNGERSVLELARSVARLHFKAVKEFRKVFAEVDAQTGEIIAALRNLPAQKRYIRKTRNKLHARLMPWDDIAAAWENVQVRRTAAVSPLLRMLYRFLAPRYMPVDEWIVRSAPSFRSGQGDPGGGADDEFAPPVRAMDWF